MTRELLLWGADPLRLNINRRTARTVAGLHGDGGVVKLLDSWGNIKAVWAVLAAGQVRRLGTRSALKFIPKDLVRMVGSVLVCL
jgi:hypothetical protein